MRFSLTTTLLTLLLLLAVVGGVWSLITADSSHPVSTNKHAPFQEDAFMEKVSATIVNQSGMPSMHIESPRMTHSPHNDTTTIQRPIVTLYRKSSGPWYIHAEKGLATHGVEKLLLTQNVSVHHPSDATDPEMQLETQSLMVFPNREEADTFDAVTITQPNAVIHSIGMNANYSTGIIHLLSDTRSEYVPVS